MHLALVKYIVTYQQLKEEDIGFLLGALGPVNAFL